MGLRVLVVDDEKAMRTILKKVIGKVERFEVLGEAKNAEEALELFEVNKPEVVFLDVEMEGTSGVECAKKIVDIEPKTIIIFATAHTEYMTEAFELYAFDYLVKPFNIERVNKTLLKIKELSNNKSSHGIDKIIKHEKGLDKIVIKNKEGISFIDTKDIVLIQREDRATAIYTLNEHYITSEGLSEVEERLDKSQFFRSHKSYIINLSMISKIFPYGRWTYIVKFKNTDRDALLTHEKYEEIKKIFV